MSFRARQRYSSSPFSHIMCSVQSINDETGVVSSKQVRACDVPALPSADLFSLDKLLDAKVDLKQVPCRVLHDKTFDVDKFVNSDKSNKRTKSVKSQPKE